VFRFVAEVIADPIQIQQVILNNGEAQRSTIQRIAIKFNQDVSFFDGVRRT